MCERSYSKEPALPAHISDNTIFLKAVITNVPLKSEKHGACYLKSVLGFVSSDMYIYIMKLPDP